MKVVARWPLLPPVPRFFLVAHTPPHGPFTGLTPLLFRSGYQDPPVLRVAFSDATISASDPALRTVPDASPGISKDRPFVVRC
jgi:hypothetical protein